MILWTQRCLNYRMCGFMRQVVVVMVALSVYHGCCQSAPSSSGLSVRGRKEATSAARDTDVPPATKNSRRASGPATRENSRRALGPATTKSSRRDSGPATTENSRRDSGDPTRERSMRLVAAVVSRQREDLLYWVLVVGAAGLGGIVLLSVLTVLLHRPGRRSQTVDMRHKHPRTGEANGVNKQNGLADGQKYTTLPADTDRNYSNVCTLAPATTRVADSVLSWGSEFEVTAGEASDNIYNNQYKYRPADHSKTGNECRPADHGKTSNGKPANVDIYVNGIAL